MISHRTQHDKITTKPSYSSIFMERNMTSNKGQSSVIDLNNDPYTLFNEWFEAAKNTEPTNANAMVLSTSSLDSHPSSRIVLLKDYDAKGFIFYTNTNSRKGKELKDNPHVALLFYWKMTHRQIRIEGDCFPITDKESDYYFATRHRMSKIGAIVSRQSEILKDRASFEQQIEKTAEKYPTDNVPRPKNWLGYRVVPNYFEFWQERPYRLHDRAFWKRENTATTDWKTGRLYP